MNGCQISLTDPFSPFSLTASTASGNGAADNKF